MSVRKIERRRSFLQSQEKMKIMLNGYISDSDDDFKPLNTLSKVQKTPLRRSRRLHSTITSPIIEADPDNEKSSSIKMSSPAIRKSSRTKTPNKRYTENFISPSTSFSKLRKPSQTNNALSSDSSSVESEKNESTDDNDSVLNLHSNVSQKASDLFDNIYQVEGKQIYGFNTPKKSGSMALLAKSTPRTPISKLKALKLETPSSTNKTIPMTPDTDRRRKIMIEMKTPRHVRNKLKEEISKWIQESTDSDFSGDESEYEPISGDDDDDDDDNDDSSEERSIEEDDDSKTKKITNKITSLGLRTPSSSKIKTNRSKKFERSQDDYVPECENYFTHHSKQKSLTSDHTLDRLKNPRLPTDRLFSLLSSMKLSINHENSIKYLLDEYKTYFEKWLYILNEGYSIILYGLGSKRNLLQEFHKDILSDQLVIVINGFFPSLTIKDVLDAFINDILELNLNTVSNISGNSNNYHDIVDIIENELSFIPQTHVFLIVHNIDGTAFRNSKSQEILSRLSKINNIHLIASIDHINTPLLWDHTKLSNFNFSWWDVTTMLPYSDETAYENSLLVQNSGEFALSSLRNVFQSLTTNSKGIYMIIVKHQLKNKGNSNYPGMQFKDLYWSCRESFLVSSDLALRAQLTEFLDHKLIKSKRTIDGSENLIIPIDDNLLQQFMSEQEK